MLEATHSVLMGAMRTGCKANFDLDLGVLGVNMRKCELELGQVQLVFAPPVPNGLGAQP